MKRKRVKQSIANEYLCDRIREQRAGGVSKLQSVQAMAQEAGVSLSTMWKSICRFKKRGLIVGTRGGSLYIAHTESPPWQPPPATRLFERLADTMEKDIVTGALELEKGELPRQKELLARYNVSHTTLKKTLELLNRRGVVLERGKQQLVPNQSTAHRTPSIVIVRIGFTTLPSLYLEERQHEFIRALEHQAWQRRVAVHTEGFYYRGEELINQQGSESIIHRATRLQDLLGFVVIGVEPSRRRLSQIAQLLEPTGKPVGVLDEQGGVKKLVARYRRFFAISIGCTGREGAIVGRWIGSSHPDRVYYIHTPEKSVWNRNRFLGLVEGVTKSVPQALVQSVKVFPPPRQVSDRARRVTAIGTVLGAHYGVDVARDGMMENMARTVEALADREIAQRFDFDTIGKTVTKILPRGRGKKTVVVAQSDSLAWNILLYARVNRLPVPGTFSLVGFDDTLDAHFYEITSYNFNMTGIGNALVNHLLACRSTPGRRQIACVLPDGYVAKRATMSEVNEVER